MIGIRPFTCNVPANLEWTSLELKPSSVTSNHPYSAKYTSNFQSLNICSHIKETRHHCDRLSWYKKSPFSSRHKEILNKIWQRNPKQVQGYDWDQKWKIQPNKHAGSKFYTQRGVLRQAQHHAWNGQELSSLSQGGATTSVCLYLFTYCFVLLFIHPLRK